ncbi:MAG: pyridoxamine 5'-phosphate oxidase family protein [Halobacteria archaeon]
MTPDSKMVEMDDVDIDQLLSKENKGTLALSENDYPYSVPVIYRYVDGDIYFKLGRPKDSKKIEIIEENPKVSFTVFETQPEPDSSGPYTELAWASVIIRGKLEEVEEREAAQVALSSEEGPAPDNPWGESRSDLEFQIYRLKDDEVSGRKGGSYEL